MMECLTGLVHDRGKLGQAWFSVDREHRYLLLRGGDIYDQPLIAYCMLNPSTADADENDRTIAKCIKFAVKFAIRRGWVPESRALPAALKEVLEGQAVLPFHIAIVNLYAVRATDPDVAFAHPRPIGGTTNDAVIAAIGKRADVMIAAWGADKRSEARSREVCRMLRGQPSATRTAVLDGRVHTSTVALHRLGSASKDGHPKHPLYLPDATELEVHSW